MTPILVLDAHALNGESPRWSRRERRLYWVDTRGPHLHVFDPATKHDQAWEMPSWIGCQVLSEDGCILAMRTGLYAFHTADASLRAIGQPPYDIRRFLFNDGGCDPKGRFIIGEMYMPMAPGDEKVDAPESAPLFRYQRNGVWIDMAASTRCSNGLAWSPDGRTMYQSDTAKQQIYAFDYDVETGQASHRRVFADVETSSKDHGPDGAAVDEEGCYICAVFGEGCLLRFDPSGKLERRIEMPIQYPTMPAYGGEDLKTLFITSATWKIDPAKRAARPLEGGLFVLELDVPGLPTNLYDANR